MRWRTLIKTPPFIVMPFVLKDSLGNIPLIT